MSYKQMIVLDFIKRFIAEHNYSPTIREIASGLGLKSPSTVHDHLKNLANQGILTFSKSKSRTIELLVENEYIKDKTLSIPIYNTDEYLDVPLYLLNNNIDNLIIYRDINTITIVDKKNNRTICKIELY